MMTLIRFAGLTVLAAIFAAFSTHSLAQGNSGPVPGHYYGEGFPRGIADLPPGQLRRDLEDLRGRDRADALRRLREASFPGNDIARMRAGQRGSIWYEDEPLSEVNEGLADGTVIPVLEVDPSLVFQLHSRAGAANVLFLDFDGAIVEGTVWNSRGNTLVARPFDPMFDDAQPDSPSFSESELSLIVEIWHRVAEDFAAFDIDVTTEEPASFDDRTGHVVFTHHIDANGVDMPGWSANAVGIGQLDVFGQADYATFYSPAFVYYTRLSGGTPGEPTYNAEVASHEFGHNLGLSHDGTSLGDAYYYGHGEGDVSWAPIMGGAYNRNVTSWSRGDYPDANNDQDDLAVIADKLGYATDDHGDDSVGASQIVVEADGAILVSSPQVDPTNELAQNKGVIDDASDADWFFIDLDEDSQLLLDAVPAWHSFYRDGKRGANLDIELSLMDSQLNLLAVSGAPEYTAATVRETLPAGRYYVQVEGVGAEAPPGYSDYASLGKYYLEGAVNAGGVDELPPSPSVMSWATPPRATGTARIEMTATTATDSSGGVEYNFSCVTGGENCLDSGWQSTATFVAGGLTPGTYYAFKVRARDAFHNVTADSPIRGATTEALPANQPPVSRPTYLVDSATIKKGRTASFKLVGSDSFDPDGSIVSYEWRDDSGAVLGEGTTLVLKLREGSYTFSLTVTDDGGATDTQSVSVTVSKGGGDSGGGDTGGGEEDGGGRGGGKGGGKKSRG